MPHPDMNASGGHPDEGLLHEWLDEQLSAADAAEMQAHVAVCAECQARVAEARGLMTASHRILSALDDVPANVIPVAFKAPSTVAVSDAGSPAAAASTVGARDVNGVTSIDAAREAANVARTMHSKNRSRWQRLASIAAVLILAVAVAKSPIFTSDDVVAPISATANEVAPTQAPTIPEMKSAPAAAAAASQARVRNVAPVESTDGSARKSTLASVDDAAKKRSPTVVAAAPSQMARKVASEDRIADPVAPAASPISGFAAAASPPAVDPAQRADATMRGARGAGGASGAAAGGRGRAIADAMGTVSNATLPSLPAVAAAGNATPPASDARRVAASPPPPRAATAERTEREMASAAASQAKSSDTTVAVVPLPPREPANALAFGGSTMLGMSSGINLAFDSVRLSRTTCAPVCEPTTLHINSLGVVRFQVGNGNTQRVAMSQLSASERSQLQSLLMLSFPGTVSRRGHITCALPTVARGNRNTQSSQPELRLSFDFPEGTTEYFPPKCELSEADVREMSVRLETIANLEALKRKLPPKP